MNNAVIWAEGGGGLVVGSLRRVLSLDFQTGISGSRSQTLSLGEGGGRSRRLAALALTLSAAG
jgi:hypothetical protein